MHDDDIAFGALSLEEYAALEEEPETSDLKPDHYNSQSVGECRSRYFLG